MVERSWRPRERSSETWVGVQAVYSIAYGILHCSAILASDDLHSQPHPTSVLTPQFTYWLFPEQGLHSRLIYYWLNLISTPFK